MHPVGCFGSSLAYEPASPVCKSCAAKAQCGQIVESRHPVMVQLLDRFQDVNGDPLSKEWKRRWDRIKRAEKK